MANIPFHNLGLVGIIRDQAPHELPPEAWSDGEMVRFQDNKVIRMQGQEQLFGTPNHAPYALMPVRTVNDLFWMYMGLTDVSVVDTSGTHTEITRTVTPGDYTGTASDIWTGVNFNGIPVISNNVDVPQMWNTPLVSNDLTDLTAWPASTTCKVMRSFKNFLIALDVTKPGGREALMVKWSHSADPGLVPDSWDETDATKDAGETTLAETSGFVQDCLPLRGNNIIYKEDSTYIQQLIGGTFIFKFDPLFSELGLLAPRCVGFFNIGAGPQHFVVSPDDVVIHNGSNPRSVIDRRMRKWLFNEIDPTNFRFSYVVPNNPEREMWFCFPQTGFQYPSIALVYNTITEAFSLRPLSIEAPHIAAGRVEETESTVWDNLTTDIWDEQFETWDERTFRGGQRRLLMADHTNTKLLGPDRTFQFEGMNYEAYVERTGLAVVGVDRQGNPKVDYDMRKLVNRIWIKASGDPFQVRLGTQESPDDPVTYTAPQTFTPGQDKYLDFTLNTRLLTVRFESQSNASWEIHSYDLDLEPAGMF
ncbi:MAG: hypothetical protein GTO00_09090 [Deltaproteobacteria bacterium]|nr:hypothetical protein [Deltaproteobacteria bacterium]